MTEAVRSPSRIILLGLIASLAYHGLSSTRPVSKAEGPARVVDKRALREQILALRVAIDVLEVEQGVERGEIADRIKEEREIPALLQPFGSDSGHDVNDTEKLRPYGGGLWFHLLAVQKLASEDHWKGMPREQPWFQEYVVGKFGRECLDELIGLERFETKAEYSRAAGRLAEQVRVRIIENGSAAIKRKLDPIRAKFARRSADLAGKKLDLESLEGQYHEP